ncbi:MAG: DUF423 domain-containing protein [Pseudomonadota bacterium]|mgnify:CR=1 FL=1
MYALTIIAALSAAMAIAAGAFGAHAAQGAAIEWLKTGGFYQLIHAVAVLVIMQRFPNAAWMLLIGSLIFSVSLYAMALGAPRWFGAITPIGGTIIIIGWLACAYTAWRSGV